VTEVEKRILRKLNQINERLDQMALALDQISAVVRKRAKKLAAKERPGEN